ncbi:serine hydrolase domain-containing protein [Bernardetia sp. ABR2-2B]|uniref:serine hydrolase domain-containing protein n=1 Tax=Bernardetia sp. ABR2-2B TaxID=3127472 RepID=UPI0030D3DD17
MTYIEKIIKLEMLKYFSVIALLFMGLSCQNKPTTYNKTSKTDSLTNKFQAIYDKGNFHGFDVSIVDNNQVFYQKAFGYADVESKKKYTLSTKHSTGSVSKTLIGISLLKAQELGKLKLDDPINKYLSFSVKNPYFPTTDITIRHLANHTSTIADTDFYDENSYSFRNNKHLNSKVPIKIESYFNPVQKSISLSEFMKKVIYTEEDTCCRETFIEAEPGSNFLYSNGGATLAAVVLERATGMSFIDFTKRYILEPLEMNASSWDENQTEATLYLNKDTVYAEYRNLDYPAGALVTNTTDLSKYLQELIKGYNGNSSLLSKNSYATLFNTPFIKEIAKQDFGDMNPFMNIKYDEGVFMGVAPKNFVGHTGSDPGIVTFLFFNSKTNCGFTFRTNRSIGAVYEETLNDLWSILKVLEEEVSEQE